MVLYFLLQFVSKKYDKFLFYRLFIRHIWQIFSVSVIIMIRIFTFGGNNMKRIIKPVLMSAVFMLSLSSCGGKSASSMVDALKNDKFEVQSITSENDELEAIELILNAALVAAGKIDDYKNGVDLISIHYAVKIDENGTHAAEINEFGNGDQANLFMSVYEDLGGETSGEALDNYVVTGSCVVGYSDDYTKGVLGL